MLREAQHLTDLVLGERVDRRCDDLRPLDALGWVRPCRVVEEEEVIEPVEGLKNRIDRGRFDLLVALEVHEGPNGGRRRVGERKRWLSRYEPSVVVTNPVRVSVL